MATSRVEPPVELEATESKPRTTLRVNLPEEVLQKVKEAAESAGVSLNTYAAFVLTKSVLER